MLLKVGGMGDKIINWITNTVPDTITNAIRTLEQVYPIVVSAVSAVSILISEDY